MRLRAFSLAEVLIAMGVLALSLMAIAGAVIYSTRMEGRAGRATQALHYANQIIDLSKLYNLPKTNPITDPLAARTALNAPPFNLEVEANDLFKRKITMTWLSNNSTDYRNELYQIDVTVYWYEKQHEESLHVVGLHRAP